MGRVRTGCTARRAVIFLPSRSRGRRKGENTMPDAIVNLINVTNQWVWAWPTMGLLLGTHLFMTLRTGGIQRKLLTAIRLSVTKDPDAEGEVSQFATLTTALASTIGTGNIIGVGTSIALGGPGAVFWCWIAGIFGIATKYAESLIAVKYRVKTKDGRMQGGAMYALERGLHLKWLGVLFALFGTLASFGIGCATQVNAIATVCQANLGIPEWVVGLVVAALTALVIFGGIQSIATVCEKLVPFMAGFYILGCLGILVYKRDYLVAAVATILRLAFTPGAAAGGLTGGGIMLAMRYGIARGLFSNESGMGSAPIVAAAAQTRNPVRQALVSASGTFWDTVVVCLMTGLVLVSSIMKNPAIDMGAISDGGILTTLAFDQIPVVGPVILVVGIISFAFSTVLGWSYYGERCLEYLVGSKGQLLYRVVYVAVAAIAPVVALNLVWTIADTLNALMAIPNLIAVLLLSGVVARETKLYLNDLDKRCEDPVPVVDR